MNKLVRIVIWSVAAFFAIDLLFLGFWYSVLARTSGIYSESTSSSCEVIRLGSDGTFTKRVDAYHDGRKTGTEESTGTWKKVDGGLLISNPDSVDENGVHRPGATFRAETHMQLGIFHTLTINYGSNGETYHRPLTGSTCWLAGMN